MTEQVDNYTQQLDEMISLGEDLIALKKNKYFKRIILDMYLKDGSDVLTRNITRVNDRDKLYEQFVARSWLYDHMDRIESEHISALDTMKSMQEEG